MIHHEGNTDAKSAIDALSYVAIGAAIDVHRARGPGLLESAYEACLFRELQHRGVQAERQVPLPVNYRGDRLDCGYRLVRRLSLGLLFNFNVVVLRTGMQRVVNDIGTLCVLFAFAVPLFSARA